MYPLFLYMALVQVHTPTVQMFFYQCKNVGTVSNFYCQDNSCEYEVAFQCRGTLVRKEWIQQGNLREVKKEKKK